MNKAWLLGIVVVGGILLISSVWLGSNETDDSEFTPPTQTVPTAFDNQFPIYPEATVINVQESAVENSQDASLGLDAIATIPEVNDWYREALSQNGWSITSDRNVAGFQIIQAEKDNLFTSVQAANGSTPDIVRISQQLKIRQ